MSYQQRFSNTGYNHLGYSTVPQQYGDSAADAATAVSRQQEQERQLQEKQERQNRIIGETIN